MSIIFAVNNAIQIIPNKAKNVVTILPIIVEGVTSPYPTVVILTTENHKALKIDPKCSVSESLSKR